MGCVNQLRGFVVLLRLLVESVSSSFFLAPVRPGYEDIIAKPARHEYRQLSVAGRLIHSCSC